MNKTKEQLIIEVTKLRDSHANWVSMDERRRREFAKAFSWSKESFYNNEKNWKLPSWEEIFIEVGKLLAKQNYSDFSRELINLKTNLINVERKVVEKIKDLVIK